MDSFYFSLSPLLWMALSGLLGAAIVYFFMHRKIIKLKANCTQLQMELNEVASSTERKMRDATQQISVLGRRLEESQRDLLMNNISFSQERENLINEIKQLNMQIAAGENELEVLRLYWARKEQEWQAVHEGLEALLAEKDQAIAELHTALAKLAAGETLSKIYARTKE